MMENERNNKPTGTATTIIEIQGQDAIVRQWQGHEDWHRSWFVPKTPHSFTDQQQTAHHTKFLLQAVGGWVDKMIG